MKGKKYILFVVNAKGKIMKKAIIFFLFLALGCPLFSQVLEEETIPLTYDTSGYLENSGGQTSLTTTSTNSTTSNEVVPTINGEMDVNSGGALTYTLPIEVFKGLNDFQPNLAVSYNSQLGNGQAGWGWNIIGLSVITQGGTSKEIDGITRGAQFNSSDPFYLDGQRLIKVNETTFETQIFSKIQISRNMESGYSFIVKYPDGKIAKYKELPGVYGQHYIDTFIDALNYEIHYTYAVSNSVPTLTKISYGGKSASDDTYKIEFTYKNRTNPVKFYKNGTEYVNSKVLEKITVSSSTGGVYRKYAFTYDLMSNGNERLRIVTVENGQGQKLKPLNFSYNKSKDAEIKKSVSGNKGLGNSKVKDFGSMAMGDFYGEGKTFPIYVQETGETKYSFTDEVSNSKVTTGYRLFNSGKGYNLNIATDDDTQLFAGKTLINDNKVTENDQLIIFNTAFGEEETETITSGSGILATTTVYYTPLIKATLSIKDVVTGKLKSYTFKLKGNYFEDGDEYTKDNYIFLKKAKDIGARNIIVADFNNDGLVDVLIRNKPEACTKLTGNLSINSCKLETSVFYFIELGKLATSASGEISPTIFTSESDHLGTPIEFDGDGIPELIFTANDQQKKERELKKFKPIEVLKVNTLNQRLEKVYESESNGFTSYNDNEEPLFYGDFNGDGLTDFIMPRKVYSLETKYNGKTGAEAVWTQMKTDKQQTWDIYTNTGKGFNVSSLDLQGITYLKPSIKNISKKYSSWRKFWSFKKGEYKYTEYGTSFIIPTDFDGDGKTDLVFIRKFTKYTKKSDFLEDLQKNTIENLLNEQKENASQVMVLQAKPSNTSGVTFVNLTQKQPISLDNNIISPYSLITGNTDYNQLNTYRSGIAIYDPVSFRNTNITINNDSFTESQLKEVNNGSGVEQKIEYYPMAIAVNTPKDRVYTTTNLNLPYPYYVHQNQVSQYLAYKINTILDSETNKALTTEYRYQNGIQHLDGKGFIGFQKTFISDPYESELKNNNYWKKDFTVPVFWRVNTFEPTMDNSLVKTTYGSLDDKAVFTESTLNYTKYDKGGHKYLILPTTETNKDLLKKITSTKTYTYDEATLYLKEAKTTVNDGFSTSETSKFTYQADFTNAGHYFSGKITKVEQILSRSGSSFTTKQESTYNTLGQLTQSKKYGNNTDALTTAYTYDAYGNILTETVSATGLSSLTTKYEYDATHRYAIKITSPDGLTATKNINYLGQVVSETSTLGLTTSYLYDNWNNLTQSTDYLNIKTNITKTKLADGKYMITTQTEGQSPASVVYDKFDREVQTQTYALGKKILTDTEYDVYGRAIRTSEPYYEGGNKLWNTVEYDYLNRPVKQTLYTGRVVTTCYEGLKVTVQDGHKKYSQTLDASGHVVESVDFGGTVKYTYTPNGFLTEAKYDNITIKMKQDGWGNKTELTDPSAGTYQYTYDDYGRLTKETTPKGTTTYAYDAYNKLKTEVSEGDGISIAKTYEYNNRSLPTKVSGYSDGKAYTYETTYDAKYRITGKKETTPYLISESTLTYDAQGKPDQTILKTTIRETGFVSTSKVKNQYNAYSELVKQLDIDASTSGTTIWDLKSINAKGQVTEMSYGNGYTLSRTYGTEFFLQAISDKTSSKTALNISYDYNVQKGVLNSRNNLVFSKNESFTYDNLDRLLTESLNNAVQNQYTYDKQGKMTYNSEVGKYGYVSNSYRLDKITFNTKGAKLKETRGFHEITYNMFKTPKEIYLPNKDRIYFEYGLLKNRSAMYYGDTGTNPQAKPKRKYYASDGSVEVTKEGTQWKVVTYIDGDAYSAHYIKVEKVTGSATTAAETKKYYLHRDNLQSIAAITDASNGNIVEQRFFDAWGNITAIKDANGQLQTANISSLLIDRGYTGHEHLLSVGLINMNGRIYDPALRRFMEPDNFVQDLYNTQNFNRYGYALNNPLLYTDPSGEIVWAIVAAVAVMVTANGIINLINGLPFWYSMGKTIVVTAITMGIGCVANSITNTVMQALAQAGMRGLSGGAMNLIDGSKFFAGFANEMITSLIHSGVEGLGTLSSFGKSCIYKAVMIASGGLSGGISSTIAGGNFGAGAMQGIIWAGLNCLAYNAFGTNSEDTSDKKDASKKTEILDPNASQTKGAKAARILGSLFSYNKDKTFMGKTLQIISHFTWELPQQFIGIFFAEFTNLVGGIDNVFKYSNGAIRLDNNWMGDGEGFTLGNLITIGAGSDLSKTLPHEFGHYIQSRRFGPLYLAAFAIPSLVHAWLAPLYSTLQEYENSFYTEKNAGILGRKYW